MGYERVDTFGGVAEGTYNSQAAMVGKSRLVEKSISNNEITGLAGNLSAMVDDLAERLQGLEGRIQTVLMPEAALPATGQRDSRGQRDTELGNQLDSVLSRLQYLCEVVSNTTARVRL